MRNSAIWHGLPWLILFVCGACKTIETYPLPGQPIAGETQARFQIELDGKIQGFLLEVVFASTGLDKHYLVQNSFGQEVGFIDSVGRAYRYSAKDGELEYIHTGTMLENLQEILRISSAPQLIRLP